MRYLICLVLLLTFSSKVSAQNEVRDLQNWFSVILKAENAIATTKVDSATYYYNAAKEISNKSNKNHYTYVLTIDRIIANHKALTENYDIDKLLESVLNRSTALYGETHPFIPKLKDELQNAQRFKDLTESVSNVYINILSELIEHIKPTSPHYQLPIKELTLTNYIWSNLQNACYYGNLWSEVDDAHYKAYKEIELISNYYYANELHNQKSVDQSLQYYVNAFVVMQTNEDLKKRFGYEILNAIFKVYMNQNDYENAINYGNLLEPYNDLKFGDQSVESAYLHNDMAICYENTKAYEIAYLSYQIAMQTLLLNLDKVDSGYEITRNNYITFLKNHKETNELIAFYKEETNKFSANNPKSPNYIIAIKDYKQIITNRNDPVELIRVSQMEVDYYKENNILDANFINAVFSLSNQYSSNSDYKKSNKIIEKHLAALNNAQKNSGFNFGDFNRQLGLDKFQAFHLKENETENNKTINAVINYLNNAISFYDKQGDPYQSYSDLVVTKAVCYSILKNLNEGFKILQAHKQKLESLQLDNSEAYILTIGLMTNFNEGEDRISKNLALNKKALEIYNNLDSYNKHDFNNIRHSQGKLLMESNKVQEAIPYYLSSYSYYLQRMENESQVKSSAAQEFKIDQSTVDFLGEIQYVNYTNEGKNEELFNTAMEAALMTKNLTLNISGNIINKIRNLDDKFINKAIKLHTKSIFLEHYLIDILKLRGNDDDFVRIKELESHINSSYANVIESYYDKNDAPLISTLNYRDIKLKPNALFIDYARVKDYKDNYVYLAYIYTSENEKPQIVFIESEKIINEKLASGDLKDLSYVSRGSLAKSSKTNALGKDLYHLIWKPIEPYLQDITTITYSLAGILNKIPIASIQNNNGELLLDTYNLRQISDASVLIKPNTDAPNINDLTIFGGINYDTQFTQNLKEKFNYLDGTEAEASAIKTIIPSAKVLREHNASESNFRALNGASPSILHLATHGFYFEYNKKPNTIFGSTLKTNLNPLKRTGLLLANGNEGINGIFKTDSDNYTDGVLTSLEIAIMDLRSTDLVVLSACETALGDIDGSEGVYGLQRAFKMAGVNYLIMSLWEIPDKETKEFMAYFYTQCKATNNISTSFRNTQKEMKNKYPENPEKWAAFILVE